MIQTNSRGSGRGILPLPSTNHSTMRKTSHPRAAGGKHSVPSDRESIPIRDTRAGGALVGNPTYAVIPVLSP